MSIETKLNLTNDKFCQTDGSLLTLSGDTQISSVGTIKYETNQSSTYTSRSLTDAGYVTGLTKQLCTTANNGITKTDCNFHLGGALTGDTFISGNYSLNICGSAKLNSNNGYQINNNTVLNSPSNDYNSIFVGINAGATGNTGNNDIAIGAYTLRKLVFGAGGGHNVAIGSQNLCNSADGCNNVAIGTSVMSASCTGSYNIGIGSQSLTRNCGSYNIGLGVSSLLCNRTGECNIGIGLESLKLNFYGCQNIAIGNQTLCTNSCGNNNIAIGLGAGFSATGNSSVFIGKNAGYYETGSDKLYIGNSQTQSLIYGDFLNNFVTLPTLKLCSTPGIGTTSDNILVWNSSDKCVKIVSGGAVLTSAITGATNGLTKTGQNVKLGGILTGDTIIYGNSKSLSLGTCDCIINAFNVNSGSANIRPTGALTLYGATISINNFASYDCNYCCSFSKYSLVDKNYVTGTTISTANNGLTSNNRNIRLGGTITGDTCITYNNAKLAFCTEGGACNISLCNLGSEVKLSSRCAYMISTSVDSCQSNVGVKNGCVDIFSNISECGVQITAPTTGAVYIADYSSGFVNESLVSKRYVTGLTTTSGVQSANNGLTKSGTNVRLGGTLTGNTVIDGAYSLGFNNSIINLTGSSCVNLSGVVNLITTPAVGSTSDNILVWNSGDKSIKTVSGGAVLTSAITGATNGLSKTGQNVKLGGTLTGNTTIGGSSTLCITAPSISTDVQHLTFDSNPITPTAFGSLFYKNNSLNFNREFSGVTLQIGEETVVRVTNTTGSLIENGSAVYICGAVSGIPAIAKTIASSSSNAVNTLGLTTMGISDNNEGYVTILGLVHDIDTSSWSAGSRIYLSSTQAGCLTATAPSYPNEVIHIGYVTCQDVLGSILVAPVIETSYTSISTFTGYTASTAIVLNNKLDNCIFNNYTGATSSTLDYLLDVSSFAVTGATNGLSKSGVRDVCLGGTISNPVTICGASSVKIGDTNGITLSTSNTNDIALNSKSCGGIYIKSQSGTSNSTVSFVGSVGLQVDYDAVNGFALYDNRVGASRTGLVYADDYSSNYVNRSLVDKAYVDSVATGLDVKSAALVSTTTNITLSGLTTVDGITLTTGDRILVKDQINGALNGIYSASTGTWGRTSDYDFSPSGEISNGNLIPVTSGNTNGNSIWILTTPNPIVSGDTLIFSKFSQQAGIIEGNGINVTTVGTNKQISVELPPSACGLQFNGTGLEVDYDIFRLGLCSATGGYVDIRATKGVASGNEIPVKINTGGTNSLYVDSSSVITCIGNPVLSANNGLNKIGCNVRLGGTLTGATTINGGTNALTFCCVCALGIGYTTSATITDANATPRGLVYAGNYSATYCDRSLVDKGYVDSLVTSGVLACNGLSKVGNTVILGGALTGNTFISYGANRLCFIDGGTSCMDIISDCSQIHVQNTSLCLRSCTLGSCVGTVCLTNSGIISISSNATNCGVRVTSPSTGAIYSADYSGNFINESLVTKRYVTGITSSICSNYLCSANNGLTKSGTNVRLGGALTGNTAITGAYTLSICGGAKLNTACGYQISGSTVLRTSPNSINNILIGESAGNSTMTGTNNFVVGCQALLSNTTGYNNIANGYLALNKNTIGYNNIANGNGVLYANTIGCNNIANGYNALYCNICGNGNIVNGYSALFNNTTGCDNIANGFIALAMNINGSNNIANGYYALYNNTTGSNNIASGCQALYCNTTANNLIAIGINALYNNKCINASCNGQYNIAVGHGSLSGNTYGCANYAFGYGALSGNTYGCYNIANGYQTLAKNTTGSDNIAIGYQSLYSNTGGTANIAIGSSALKSNTKGLDNIAIGCISLNANTLGCFNTAIGGYSLNANTIGNFNIAVGNSALMCNTCGCNNTAYGYSALGLNSSGCNNLSFGFSSNLMNTTGNNNIGLGYRAGYSNSTGSNNIFIGTCAGYNETGSGKLYIATGATNQLIYGDFATKEVTLPKLKVCETPATGSFSDNVLVWNSSDKCVKQYNLSSCFSNAITGATNGLTITGQKIKLGGSLTGNTDISGAYTLGFNNSIVNVTGSTSVNISSSGSVNINGTSSVGITGSVKLLTTPSNGACSDSALVWNSSDNCIKKVSANGLFGIYSITGVSTNATLSADNQVIFVDTTSGVVTITLPTAATITNGKVYMVKNTACGLINNVIIDSGLNSTIDGSRCALINTNYGALQLIRACTAGSNSVWYTLSFNN
jgi:hypothetical protein